VVIFAAFALPVVLFRLLAVRFIENGEEGEEEVADGNIIWWLAIPPYWLIIVIMNSYVGDVWFPPEAAHYVRSH
jgi:hypothetical protein